MTVSTEPPDPSHAAGQSAQAEAAQQGHAAHSLHFPQAQVTPRQSWMLPLVWIFPLIAALIGGWILLHTYQQKGPSILVQFKTAEGLEAGKTKVKYKQVDMGTVRSIALARDTAAVNVKIDMVKEAESFLVKDTRFWVVRPRVAAEGISGLSTLLSGAYITLDPGKSQEEESHYVGLETAPIVTSDLPGREFILHAQDMGSLGIGSPVYYRQIQVGQIIGYELDQVGKSVNIRVFVNAPYDRYVTVNTRFWQASGVDVTLDASGIKIDTQSLASILVGGIAFLDPPSSSVAAVAPKDKVFELAPNRMLAMRIPDVETKTLMVYFKESLKGLSVGAPVDFRGITIGEVKSVSLEYDPDAGIFKFPVLLNIFPERLKPYYLKRRSGVSAAPAMNGDRLLDSMVERGFRAQLRTGNLLTGQLFVELDFFPEAVKAKVDWSQETPVLPSIPGSLDDLQESLSRIVKRIDKMPLEVIAQDIQSTIRSLDQTLQKTSLLMTQVNAEVAPEMRRTMEEARQTLNAAEKAFTPEAPLQRDARETLRELTRAARSLQDLTDYLARHPESLLRGKSEEKP